MKKVTKEQFYNTVGNMDVVLSVIGNFPYTTEFKLRNGTIKGKSVEKYSDHPDEYTTTDYYVYDNI